METAPASRIRALEDAYRRIQARRMAGLPLLNGALTVQAVGFRAWEDCWLGVLVTPWFMNLMLLPGAEGAGETLAPGSSVVRDFPAGPYEFIVGTEAGVGPCLCCSLFSPMFEFPSQESAVATAEAALAALLKGAETPAAPPPDLRTRMARPVSRRALLRGFLPGAGEEA